MTRTGLVRSVDQSDARKAGFGLLANVQDGFWNGRLVAVDHGP